ncbi:MAG: hypothetical protein ACYT04_27760 [Nostoc sp.]
MHSLIRFSAIEEAIAILLHLNLKGRFWQSHYSLLWNGQLDAPTAREISLRSFPVKAVRF